MGEIKVASASRERVPNAASMKNNAEVDAIKEQLIISGTEKKYERGRSMGKATVVERPSIAMIGESSLIKV